MKRIKSFNSIALLREALNKAFPFMVRQALQPHSRRYAHEWKQELAVRPELVEGLNQRFLRGALSVTAVLLGTIVLSGCNRQQQASADKPINDFPTQARVEYVFECMKDKGEQNYDNLYHCVCSVDKIAGLMSYEDFSQAQTFAHFAGLAGDRGGEFRDPPQSEILRNRLKDAKAAATRACFPATGISAK